LREGDSYMVGGTPRTLTAFKTLGAPAPGQAQGHSVVHDRCVALAKFADKAVALLEMSPLGLPQTLAVSGGTVNDQPSTTTIKSFGVPTSLGGVAIARAKLSDKTERIGAFFEGFNFPLLDSRNPVPGHPDARIKSMKDPVVRDFANFAVLAKLTGTDAGSTPITSANDDAIIGQFSDLIMTARELRGGGRRTNGVPMSSLVVAAREGQPAPGTSGATFGKFKSLLVPEGPDAGVVFLAQLTLGSAGVTSANNDGIWAYTNGAGLHLVVREGDAIDLGDGSETVKKIVAFKTVGGSPDHQRSGLTHDAPQVLILLQVQPASGDAFYRVVSIQK
jgi:hypothetical protein